MLYSHATVTPNHALYAVNWRQNMFMYPFKGFLWVSQFESDIFSRFYSSVSRGHIKIGIQERWTIDSDIDPKIFFDTFQRLTENLPNLRFWFWSSPRVPMTISWQPSRCANETIDSPLPDSILICSLICTEDTIKVKFDEYLAWTWFWRSKPGFEASYLNLTF